MTTWREYLTGVDCPGSRDELPLAAAVFAGRADVTTEQRVVALVDAWRAGRGSAGMVQELGRERVLDLFRSIGQPFEVGPWYDLHGFLRCTFATAHGWSGCAAPVRLLPPLTEPTTLYRGVPVGEHPWGHDAGAGMSWTTSRRRASEYGRLRDWQHGGQVWTVEAPPEAVFGAVSEYSGGFAEAFTGRAPCYREVLLDPEAADMTATAM